MTEDIKIVRYTPDDKKIWDEFVESSKNGTFLFKRDYMDYHADRFQDHSLMIYRKGKLYCLLPANLKENVLASHGGLTYGGLIMNEKCSAEGILDVFEAMFRNLKSEDINKMIYKPVPHIYHTLPAEEDLYALFRCHAKLTVRNISATIKMSDPLRFQKDRREAVRRAERNGLYVKGSNDFRSFWKVLEDNLMTTYSAKPVHSYEEMNKIVAAFPENIKLFAVYDQEDNMIGGLVAFITQMVFHAQYISATLAGKKMGAIDSIICYLMENMNEILPSCHYLDLGTSNGDGGYYLNESLIYQKEGFGGRGIAYDAYELEL